MKHGEWLPWCRENLKFPYRTGARYVELFNGRDKFADAANLGIESAYRLLSQPAEDQETEPAAHAREVRPLPVRTPTGPEGITMNTERHRQSA
jgi:hypothetical protein